MTCPQIKLLPAQAKLRPQSTLDGESSQSLSFSKAIEFRNSKHGLNPRNSESYEDALAPAKDKILGLERHDLDGKEMKPRIMDVTDSRFSMDRSSLGEIRTQKKDMNSKPGPDSEQKDCRHVKDKPLNSQSQFQDFPGYFP